jgi:trans-aconitate methyltransferase
MKAIDLFNHWATLGKDSGMEYNHAKSVKYMLRLIPDRILMNSFSFLDVGCGNGWVVRKMQAHSNCNLSIGIDGSKNMISKAILNDSDSKYVQLDLNSIVFNTKVDVVFSMEVFYYLDNPKKTIKYIIDNILNEQGILIIGLDHYKENFPSLSWPNDLNVNMHTYSINDWDKILQELGLINIKTEQFGSKNEWSGTLILSAQKKLLSADIN